LYRDMLAEKQYIGDLRNRVVGARLQKDGLMPYFYKWKKGDGIRYYDPDNFDSLQAANITASPFFHYLLYPIADWRQRTINNLWLIAEYASLFLLVSISLLLTRTHQQQWLVIGTGCFFLLTEAWKMHIGNGQNYIFIPLLAMVFYYCLSNKRSWFLTFLAGTCAVAIVLIKPSAVLFLLPFLLVLKKYSGVYLALLLMPLLIAVVWIISGSREIMLWKQYKENITQQIKAHQQQSPVMQVNEPDPHFTEWEGIDMKAIDRQTQLHPVPIFSENGNFFVLARMVFHKNINTKTLFIIACCCMVLALLLFYNRHNATGFSLPALALIGFALFMILDLFSPVYRHQYYGVQWLFPLLLGAAVYRPVDKKIYVLLAAGMLLNIVNIRFVPMEHTMGEYIMLVAIIVLSLRRETANIQ